MIAVISIEIDDKFEFYYSETIEHRFFVKDQISSQILFKYFLPGCKPESYITGMHNATFLSDAKFKNYVTSGETWWGYLVVNNVSIDTRDGLDFIHYWTSIQ